MTATVTPVTAGGSVVAVPPVANGTVGTVGPRRVGGGEVRPAAPVVPQEEADREHGDARRHQHRTDPRPPAGPTGSSSGPPPIPGGKPSSLQPGSGRGDTASSMRSSTSWRSHGGGGRKGSDAIARNRPSSIVRRSRQASHRRAWRFTRAPTAGVNRPSQPSSTSANRLHDDGSAALSARLRSRAPTEVSARSRSREARVSATAARTPSTSPSSSLSSWWRRLRWRTARSFSDSSATGSHTTSRGSSSDLPLPVLGQAVRGAGPSTLAPVAAAGAAAAAAARRPARPPPRRRRASDARGGPVPSPRGGRRRATRSAGATGPGGSPAPGPPAGSCRAWPRPPRPHRAAPRCRGRGRRLRTGRRWRRRRPGRHRQPARRESYRPSPWSIARLGRQPKRLGLTDSAE